MSLSILGPAAEESGNLARCLNKMEFKKNYIHNPSDGLVCITPSRTQQQFKEECDVNNILRNYVDTGVLTHVSNGTPVFGDFSQLPTDYGEALLLIRKSREQFDLLPSHVRERFDNEPANLIKFLQDSSNRDEAIELGLVNKHVDNVVEK